MDMMMVDVTEIPGVKTEDDVLLIDRTGRTGRTGQNGRDRVLTAHEVAQKAGTVCYEILSRIGSRVERVYIHG